MICRELFIGKWQVYFIFATEGYDVNPILDMIYDLDAPDYILVRAGKKMEKAKLNEGFTYSNGEMRKALVVIGPSTSGKEFVNTLTHELHHVAVAVAKSLGVDLEGETPAYLAGDSARELAEVICRLGCDHCRG